jgi:subtilisin family serine protease
LRFLDPPFTGAMAPPADDAVDSAILGVINKAWMSRSRTAIAVLCALALYGPVAARAAEPGGPTAPGSQSVTRVLVRFASDASPAQRAEMRARADVERDATLAVRGLEVVDPEPGVSVGAAVADLERMDGVLYAEPDHVLHQSTTPDDPLLSYEWGLTAIRAPDAWDVTTGSPQVTVAVVDTGIDASHPDLSPNLWTNPGESGAGRESNGLDDDGDGRIDDVHGWDFVDGDAQPQDGNGHGTHVSGTIAARGDNGTGVAGVTWSTTIMPLRVLGNDGSGFVSDVLTAYAYAARRGARVVNASLGGGSYSRAEHDALAAAPDTLFVVAAGNDGADDDATPEYPCDYDLANVVCVAASDRDDMLASFSNYGATNVDLAAPGVDIASTWPGGRFVLLDGTSMATPHVSGAAALLLAHDGGLTVAGLRAALLSSAHPVPALAGLLATGGRLDAAAALSVPHAPPEPPAAPPAAPVSAVVAPSSAASAADHTAPGMSLRIDRGNLRTVRARGLRLALGASEACRARIEVRIDATTSRRLHLASRIIGRVSVRLNAPGRRAVTVRVSTHVARALRAASHLRVVARAVAVDASGNYRGTERAATLRR